MSVAAAVGLAIGCGKAGAFQCADDQQCEFQGVVGVCVSTGYCAFPDPDCSSELSYGEHAGGGLAGDCVPPDGGTTSTSGTDSNTGGTTDVTASGNATEPTSGAGPGTGSEGTSGTTDTSGGTGGGSGGSTGGTARCGNKIVEAGEYCDGPVDNGMCRADCTALDCDGGFDDCDGQGPTGCEADLTEPTHCGSCSNQCDSTLCFAQQCAPLAFVTESAYAPSQIGGVYGADALCQAEATAAGKTGTYQAWIAAGTKSPATTFNHSTLPYVRPDGTLVALSYADLINGGPSSPILLTLGLTEPTPAATCSKGVWTNVSPTGQTLAPQACQSFTGSVGNEVAKTGTWDAIDDTWSEGCTELCTAAHPLYCFQQ